MYLDPIFLQIEKGRPEMFRSPYVQTFEMGIILCIWRR